MRDVFEDAQGYRSTLIARTETTRAAGWGNVTAFKEGGAEAKEWVATRDNRTRDDHDEMDGQVVGIDEPFETPGGEDGDHPGDFDDPAEDCNCRCTVSVADKSEIGSDDEDEEGDAGAPNQDRPAARRRLEAVRCERDALGRPGPRDAAESLWTTTRRRAGGP